MPNKDEQEKNQQIDLSSILAPPSWSKEAETWTPKTDEQIQSAISAAESSGQIYRDDSGAYQANVEKIREAEADSNVRAITGLTTEPERVKQYQETLELEAQKKKEEEAASLAEKYGASDKETNITRKNKEFEYDSHGWGDTGITGSKRNETGEDGAYHWTGHENEDGTYTSGLSEWAADNQERINYEIESYNSTIDNEEFHTEEEVQIRQQNTANLYYDCGNLEEYQQQVVDDFKAKYDQTYASASEEEKKALDDELAVLEHNLGVYSGWKDQAKELYDKWSNLNTIYDAADDNKRVDVNDVKYYQERGLDGEYLYGGDTPENIQIDIDNTRAWADLQEKQLKLDTMSGHYSPDQLDEKRALIAEERARAKDLEDNALPAAIDRKAELEKKNANLELERKYIFTSKLEDWQNAAVNLNKDLDAAKKAGNESEIARIENELLFVNDKADVITKYDLEKKYYAINEDGSYAVSNEELNKRIAELSPQEAAKQEKKTAPVRTAKEIEAEIMALSPSKDRDKIDALRKELDALGTTTVTAESEEPVGEEKPLTDAEKWELDLLLEIRDERELEEKFQNYVKDSGLDQATAAKKFYDESNAALDEAFKKVADDNTMENQIPWGPIRLIYAPSDKEVEEHQAAYDEARKQASYAFLMYQRSLGVDKDYAKNVEAGKKNAPGIDKLYGTFSEIDKSNEGASKVNLGKLAGLGITGEAADTVCRYLSTMGVTANDILPRTAMTTEDEKATNMYAFNKTARLWTQDELDSYYSLWGKGDIEGAMDYALRLNSSISSSYHDQIKQNMINAKLFAAETNKAGAITEALLDPWVMNPLNITALGDWLATTDQVNRMGVDVMHNKFTPYQLSNLVTEVNSTVVRDTAKHPEFASLLYGA